MTLDALRINATFEGKFWTLNSEDDVWSKPPLEWTADRVFSAFFLRLLKVSSLIAQSGTLSLISVVSNLYIDYWDANLGKQLQYITLLERWRLGWLNPLPEKRVLGCGITQLRLNLLTELCTMQYDGTCLNAPQMQGLSVNKVNF